MKVVLAVAALLALAAPAHAATAPGAVTFTLQRGIVAGVDPLGVQVGTALPGGGAIAVTRTPNGRLQLVQVRPDGSLDAGFGAGGIATVTLPQQTPLYPLQVLRRPDGRLVVIANGISRKYRLPQLYAVALSPAGRLDASFGEGGVAAPADLQASCASCDPAALAPDGSLVLTGNVGEIPREIETDPSVTPRFTWVVARLTPAGTLDAGFAGDGMAELPGENGAGWGAAVLGSGDVAVVGRADLKAWSARLSAGGALLARDEQPSVLRVAARPDGGYDLLEMERARLRRYRADGTLAAEFSTTIGEGGRELFVTADGTSTVVVPEALGATQRFRLARIAADGTVAIQQVDSPFGAATFWAWRPFARSDGGLFVPGAVAAVQYLGEGAGLHVEQAALVAVTRDGDLDPAFGGPRRPASLTVRLAPQRARTAVRTRAIRLIARTSGPLSCNVEVTSRGRSLLLPRSSINALVAFHTGGQRLTVRLTRAQARYIGPRRRPVRVSLACIDLLGARASAVARGTLR